jgi:hypothetical protein
MRAVRSTKIIFVERRACMGEMTLNSWSSVHDKAQIVHLFKNFIAFYGTQRFIIVFKSVLH